MIKPHTFHIPVMGIGFTIDTALKVSPYGIDSVISLVDDELLEELRKMYCNKSGLEYIEITQNTFDYRAKRITSYLNLIKTLAEKNFIELINSVFDDKTKVIKYFSMLPNDSELKKDFNQINYDAKEPEELHFWLSKKMTMGSIDVNIMTKVDKINYFNKTRLSSEYNDAHAAVRGYAKSELESSLILSAGINPGLFNYLAQFNDFYPDHDGNIKKKIVLKVSDYRSAIIQGKYLAKKGLWVSEFRIESGLNCGGHAFATNGYLLGPILAEFKNNKDQLIQTLHQLMIKTLVAENRAIPKSIMDIKITAQGGVGNHLEHKFLLEHYKVDSVGWGTPFLLVPEVVNIDDFTLQQLLNATEKDLYLSNISPLGIPFNSLRGNTKDIEKNDLINKGKPGSKCPKKYVTLNHEFSEDGICSASRQYQRKKIKELDEKNLTKADYQYEFEKIVDKSCICVGLGTSVKLINNLDTNKEGKGVSICPGPNLAYFSKIMKLEEMIDHIYGRSNHLKQNDRPNMFINEIKIYINYLKNKINDVKPDDNSKQNKSLLDFADNIQDGIEYYRSIFNEFMSKFDDTKSNFLSDLDKCLKALNILYNVLKKPSIAPVLL